MVYMVVAFEHNFTGDKGAERLCEFDGLIKVNYPVIYEQPPVYFITTKKNATSKIASKLKMHEEKKGAFTGLVLAMLQYDSCLPEELADWIQHLE